MFLFNLRAEKVGEHDVVKVPLKDNYLNRTNSSFRFLEDVAPHHLTLFLSQTKLTCKYVSTTDGS